VSHETICAAGAGVHLDQPERHAANSSVAVNTVQAQSGSTDFAIHQHMTTYAIVWATA
jgi:hypothetical protein